MGNKYYDSLEKRKPSEKTASLRVYGIYYPKMGNNNATINLLGDTTINMQLRPKLFNEDMSMITADKVLVDFISDSTYLGKNVYRVKKVASFFREALVDNSLDPESCDPEVICNDQVVLSVCEKVNHGRTQIEYRTLIKRLIQYIYGQEESILKLDPSYFRLINIVRFWGRDFKKRTRVPASDNDHPMLKEYLLFLKRNNVRGMKNYRDKINYFLRWLLPEDKKFIGTPLLGSIDITKITYRQVESYLSYLDERVGKGEICQTTSALNAIFLKNWLQFLKDNGKSNLNPGFIKTRWIKNKKNFELPTFEDIQVFLNTVHLYSRYPLEDIAIFSLFVVTGLRSISVLGSEVGDFDPLNSTLRVTLKGGETHLQALPSITVLQIERYLETRIFQSKNYNSEPLWINCINKRMTYDSIYALFNKYMKLAGIKKTIKATHLFRHLFMSEMINNHDIEIIRVGVGASSTYELEPYLHTQKQQLNAKFNLKYPALPPMEGILT